MSEVTFSCEEVRKTESNVFSPAVMQSFPPFSILHCSADYIIIGGGGGASKTGVKNQLLFYQFQKNKLLLRAIVDTHQEPAFSLSQQKKDLIACGMGYGVLFFRFGEKDNKCCFDSLATATSPATDKININKKIRKIGFDREGQLLATIATQDPCVHLWDISNEKKPTFIKETKLFHIENAKLSCVLDFDFSPANDLFLAVCPGLVGLWRTEEIQGGLSITDSIAPKQLKQGYSINGCRWIRSELFVVACVQPKKGSFLIPFSVDKELKLKEEPIVTMFSHIHHTSLNFDSKNSTLAVGSAGGDICVVDCSKEFSVTMKSSKVHTLPVTGIVVFGVDEGADAKSVVSCSVDGTVVVTPVVNNMGKRWLIWLLLCLFLIWLVYKMLFDSSPPKEEL